MEKYYKILNVKEGDSYEKIKKNYRKLQIKYHPDKGGNEEMFIKINDAYTIINEKIKNNKTKQNNNLNNCQEDFFNLFLNISKNLKKSDNLNNLNKENILEKIKKKINKPSPIIRNIEITLEEAYTGKSYPLNIERWYLDNNVKVKEKETIYIDIYPGIDNNELIILRNKGNIINEDNKGDIKIFVKIVNDTNYKREGLNLIYKKKLTLKEVLVGFSFKIKHLSGKDYVINSNDNKIININDNKKFQNMGMKRNNNTGLLIIIFDIIFPENLSKTQKMQISKIL